MTSLQKQLKKLKKAPTQALAVERDYSSLLFTKKEAAGHDKEEYYKIGLTGLAGMKVLDDDFDIYEAELFQKEKLKFNRATLGKEEAKELDAKIESIILRLSPYFHHQCCKQLLEWLIHNYQVHYYNAEMLFHAFLPYHSVNSFGRLIHILKFNSPDMDWIAEYQKDASPIPLNILCRACQSGNSFWLISSISSFIQKMVDILNDEYVDKKIGQNYFTFLASLFGTLIENNSAGNINEQFLSRLIPFLGIALKYLFGEGINLSIIYGSKIDSLKCAGIMLLCILLMNVNLSQNVIQSFSKLLFYKIKPKMCELILKTTNMICERSEIKELPKNSILRMVAKNEELELTNQILNLMANFDMTAFTIQFWKIIIDELKNENMDEEMGKMYTKLLIDTMDLGVMEDRQAYSAIGNLMDLIMGNGGIKEELGKHIRAMVIRFPMVFDKIKAEREEEEMGRLMEKCNIQKYEIGTLELEENLGGQQQQMRNGGKKRKRKSGNEGEEEMESRKIKLGKE